MFASHDHKTVRAGTRKMRFRFCPRVLIFLLFSGFISTLAISHTVPVNRGVRWNGKGTASEKQVAGSSSAGLASIKRGADGKRT